MPVPLPVVFQKSTVYKNSVAVCLYIEGMEMDVATEIPILVIGKTGNGKSALCNTILGAKHFHVGRSMAPTTLTVQQASAQRFGYKLKITDTPDVTNVDLDIHTEIEKWKRLIPNPRAVVLAIRCDVRYTAEEYDIYRQLCKLLGAVYVKRRLAVAFNFGDRQDNDIEQELETVCQELKKVLKDARNGYVLFDNTANEEDKTAKVQDLLRMVERDDGSWCRYKSLEAEELQDTQLARRLLSPVQRCCERFPWPVPQFVDLMSFNCFFLLAVVGFRGLVKTAPQNIISRWYRSKRQKAEELQNTRIARCLLTPFPRPVRQPVSRVQFICFFFLAVGCGALKTAPQIASSVFQRIAKLVGRVRRRPD